jgi:RimJ/RimL family protein N-acetyltransferase
LWAVILKEEDIFIGQCGISPVHIDGKVLPEIGYHINKKYWCKGYATEAAKACMDYGFIKLGIDELFIHTWTINIPSRRIAEKIGMQEIKEFDKKIPKYGLVMRHVVYTKKKQSM